jgi:HK97 family phage major capsid protein
MTFSTTSGAAVLTPEQVMDLVIQPLLNTAVCTRVSTPVQTASHDTRSPLLKTDPTADWTPESQEIDITDPVVGELVITPPKVAGLVVVSNEFVNDSDPSALEIVGQGLVRDIRDKIDSAYFGNTVANGPDGIESLANVATTTSAFDGSLDVVAEAISLGEQNGVTLDEMSLVLHPTDTLRLGTAKTDDTDSNVSLLAPDASSPTKRSVLGVPLYSCQFVTEGTGWLIPHTRTFVVIRQDASVVSDPSPFFSSDRTAVRAVMRVSPAFPHEEAIVRVAIDGGS